MFLIFLLSFMSCFRIFKLIIDSCFFCRLWVQMYDYYVTQSELQCLKRNKWINDMVRHLVLLLPKIPLVAYRMMGDYFKLICLTIILSYISMSGSRVCLFVSLFFCHSCCIFICLITFEFSYMGRSRYRYKV